LKFQFNYYFSQLETGDSAMGLGRMSVRSLRLLPAGALGRHMEKIFKFDSFSDPHTIFLMA
jgi:hypothetical protein